MAVKTDNASITTKIAIRRWLLDRMDITEARVLDTCCGLGKIWTAMEEHVTIRQWTRCDVKPRRAGVLALDATTALQKFPLDVYNVIDIDPYGEPWEPFYVVLQRLTQPTAVFLTRGHTGVSGISMLAANIAGIPAEWHRLLPKTPKLADFVADNFLSHAWRHVNIEHAAVARIQKSGGTSVTYYALALEPKCQRR